MLRYLSMHRYLIPIVFALAVCTTVSCLLSAAVCRTNRTDPAPLPMSNEPRFALHVPPPAASPVVAKPAVICQIHRSPMESVPVPVLYGLLGFDDRRDAYRAARRASFPHCDDPGSGGCVAAAQFEIRDVCQKCNAARSKWLRDRNQKSPP